MTAPNNTNDPHLVAIDKTAAFLSSLAKLEKPNDENGFHALLSVFSTVTYWLKADGWTNEELADLIRDIPLDVRAYDA
jgi:hypothetical protein